MVDADERSLTSLFSTADLPIAVMMFALGFNVEGTSLANVMRQKTNVAALLTTLTSTVLVVPVLAVLSLKLVPGVPAEGVLGILTVGFFPGGPLANMVAVITGANAELNVLLTSIEQLLSLALVPFGLLVILPACFVHRAILVPYTEMIHGILIVLTPLLLGAATSAVSSCRDGAAAALNRARKQLIFRCIVLLAVLIGVYEHRQLFLSVIHGGGLSGSRTTCLQEVLSAGGPAQPTVLSGMLFGCLTVAWSVAAGYALPGQPRANRISMCLEIGIKDGLIATIIATLGLPSLSVAERTQVEEAVLVAAVTCNGGVVLFALISCGLGRAPDSRIDHRMLV